MADLLAVLGFLVALALIAAVLAWAGVLKIYLSKPRPRKPRPGSGGEGVTP